MKGGFKSSAHYGSVGEKVTRKMSVLNSSVYILGMSGKNYTEAHNFRVSLDEKQKLI